MPTAPPVEITVTGLITGPEGAPMPAVLVFRPRGAPGDDLVHARTDSSGAYSVRLFPGTYEVWIEPSAEGLLRHVEAVAFRRTSTRFDHSFSGHQLTGTVRDPEGSVVDSGRVAVEILTPSPYTIGVTELKDGTYSFTVSTGTYSLHATAGNSWSGFPRGLVSPVGVRADTTVDIDLAGLQVSGAVAGPDAAPMEAVAVEAHGPSYVQTQSGADGRYRLWVHPGSYRFKFWPLDSFHIAPRWTDPVQVQGPSTLDFDLAGVQWSGKVVWRATGGPVPYAWVVAFEGAAEYEGGGAGWRTDAGGTFRLILAPGKTYSLRVYSGGVREIVMGGFTAGTDTTFEILADPISGP
jgi:hypothetical protein